MPVNGLVIFLDSIPFIYYYNNPFSTVMGYAGNLGVLICHTLSCVYDHQDDICPLNSRHGADYAESFQFFLNL